MVLVCEETLRYKAGADGEILLGALVISAEVVPVRNTFPVEIPVPGNELHTGLAGHTGQDCTVEICQHPAAVLQATDLQRGSTLHLPHVFGSGANDFERLVLCLQPLRSGDVPVSDAADLVDLAERLPVQHHIQMPVLEPLNLKALSPEDTDRFSEVSDFCFFCHCVSPLI